MTRFKRTDIHTFCIVTSLDTQKEAKVPKQPECECGQTAGLRACVITALNVSCHKYETIVTILNTMHQKIQCGKGKNKQPW